MTLFSIEITLGIQYQLNLLVSQVFSMQSMGYGSLVDINRVNCKCVPSSTSPLFHSSAGRNEREEQETAHWTIYLHNYSSNFTSFLRFRLTFHWLVRECKMKRLVLPTSMAYWICVLDPSWAHTIFLYLFFRRSLCSNRPSSPERGYLLGLYIRCRDYWTDGFFRPSLLVFINFAHYVNLFLRKI